MSSFGGLHIALSGLKAAQQGLTVTAHNVANVGTDGYSRQRVNTAAEGGPVGTAIHSRWEGGGFGTKVVGIQRLRDEFLQLRSYQEHAAESRMLHVATTALRVEAVFGEPSDTAIAAQLADFWAGWDDLANRPGDTAARSQLVARAATLTSGINSALDHLDRLRASTTVELEATVAEVKALAERIAEANRRIGTANAAGVAPNDLLDQRDLMIGQLAELVGVTVRPNENGMVDVVLGGTALVRGARVEELELAPTASGFELRWPQAGYTAEPGGLVAGQLSTIGDLIPRYSAALADVSATLRTTVNAVHSTAQKIDGDPGGDFFVLDGAGRIQVRADLLTDPTGIAVAAPGEGPLGSGAASQLAGTTNVDEAYRSLIVTLAVETQTAIRRAEIQGAITDQVVAAVQADSGVSLDEEMAAMVTYQHSYAAAARVLTAVDEALQTLIGRTGLVGR